MFTPWGMSDSQTTLADGITSISTPGHGGIHLRPDINELMPDYMRNTPGFYEEDCEWAQVAVVFPQVFEKKIKGAKNSLRNYQPEMYERFFNTIVMPGESRCRDEHIHQMQNHDKYQTLTAWGDWQEGVPEGMVGVFAGRGGRLGNGPYPADTAYFLVPEIEYRNRNGTFIVDESRHIRVADFTKQEAIT